MNQLDRWELLAAETYSYSYDNYADHRGNLRFDQYMPEDVRVLDRAIRESWPLDRVAKKLERSNEEANLLLSAFRDALEVVDAPTPAESFRRSTDKPLSAHSLRESSQSRRSKLWWFRSAIELQT
jgi:hypothetical protein